MYKCSRCDKTYITEAWGDTDAGKPSPTPCPGCGKDGPSNGALSEWCNALGCGWRIDFRSPLGGAVKKK
jgi:hypothetical protein